MPFWTYKLLLAGNLIGLVYSVFLFFMKKGAEHPLFEKDLEIRSSVTRRLGRFSFFHFSFFSIITMAVFSLQWSEANVRALLLFEIGTTWAIERYYGGVIKGMWEKRKGFYHGPAEERCRWLHVLKATFLLLLVALFHLAAGHLVSAGVTSAGALFFTVAGRRLPRGYYPLFQKTALLAIIFLFLGVAVRTGSAFLPLPLMLFLFLF